MKPIHILTKAVAISSLLVIGITSYSHAQSKSIKLTIKDKATQKPLEHAAATLINLKDSMIVCTQVTPESGIAQFNINTTGRYQLIIEKEGYSKEARYSIITKKEEDRNDMDIAMQPAVKKRLNKRGRY
ncbi:carboxypeptidase regulatory-like domain-containing protein [Mucilaginibacter sp. Bleaf8]|uniref:carboxypeptidase-like regulatory domain-containing protein n=1 Tax=Mucilaginibacter sp. Bleaf8 TaxID=2834430 RepID=UPI001BCBA1B4|nr:carboxypeptidase-like regulatory domain-containing protein [Mucilaginibacter sp. Bleaf8]MBS7565621.1 carboxypeptidase regulatory-like domain-containing protein [Mucilaginibacter sp. Bleaf8]